MNDSLMIHAPFLSMQEIRRLARAGLLARYGIDEGQLNKTLNSALTGGGDFADIYLKERVSESWSLEGGEVRGGSYRCDTGFGLRVLKGEEATFASSQIIGADALQRIAMQVRGAGTQGACAQSTKPVPMMVTDQAIYQASHPFDGIDAAGKISLLTMVDRIARACDARVTEVNAMLSAGSETIWVARHDGFDGADVRPMLVLSVSIHIQSGDKTERVSSGIGGRYAMTEWSEDMLKDFLEKMVNAALIKLEAKPAPAGSMPVVVGPGWNGVLLHEAVGHGLEADGIRRGASAFAGRFGERVAAPGVTIVDDGTLQGRRGSLNIDDEGCPTQRTVLIEDGVLRMCMQDSLNARLMNQRATGNGRRESYTVMPMPRMTNTFMLNGDRDPAEIVASVKKGIYVAGLEGGQVDITSGRFVFSASEAFLIEDGKITAPVKGATITGNGPETIRKISLVGNDLDLDTGRAMCGKAGQSVPVGVGQPTLLVDDMTVGGTA